MGHGSYGQYYRESEALWPGSVKGMEWDCCFYGVVRKEQSVEDEKPDLTLTAQQYDLGQLT